MRILRATMYRTPDDAVSMVMREVDVRSWHEAVAHAGQAMPGGLVLVETFAMPGEPSIQEASFEAERRRRANLDRERNMAILYHYGVVTLARINPGGTWQTSRPAPLTADEIRVALRQLAQHPVYRDQTAVFYAADGTTVELRNGRVSGGAGMNG